MIGVLLMIMLLFLRSHWWDKSSESILSAFSDESYLDKNRNNLRIWLSNYGVLPLEILKVEYLQNGSYIAAPIEKNNNDLICDNLGCFVYVMKNPSQYSYFDIRIPASIIQDNFDVKKLRISFRLMGDNKIKKIYLSRRQHHEETSITNSYAYSNTRIDTQIKKHPFLLLSKSKKILNFRQGRWTVRSDIIIPKGYRVIIREDTQLNFAENTAFISYSPLDIRGSKKKPVVFQPAKKSWGRTGCLWRI